MGEAISEAEFYGRLAQENPSAWEAILNSGEEPLFVSRRIIPKDKDRLGPTLTSSGEIGRDMCGREADYFIKHASEEQFKFYQSLLEVNPQAAEQYMLVLTGLIDVWKKDIKWLKVARHYFEQEEQKLESAEREVQKGSKLEEVVVEFIPVLKRHFPDVFQDLKINGSSPTELADKIRIMLEEKVKPEEKLIGEYLQRMEVERPYLLRNTSSQGFSRAA